MPEQVQLVKSQKWQLFIQALLLVLLVEEAIRYSFQDGDFMGYIGTGKLVLEGGNIYSYWHNTWPPFFALFSVPLSLLDDISPFWLRVVWQLGSLLAFYHIMQITVRVFNDKKLLLPFQRAQNEQEWEFTRLEVIVPFFILLKYLIDNLSNIQINIYMLWCCMLALDYYTKGKNVLPALLLALTISLKVYTIFFFLLFLYKREWKLCLFTLIFIIGFNLISFVVFGYELAMQYYIHWGKAIANGFPDLIHRNQSFSAMIWRLTVDKDPETGWQINLLSITFDESKKLVYLFLGLAAIWPAWLMRRKNVFRNYKLLMPEYAFFLAVIPLLSPLAWKAYFIFLWPVWYILYQEIIKKNKGYKLDKILYYVAIFLFIFTSDMFVGPAISDAFEVFSGITVSAIICLLLVLRIRLRMENEPV